MQKSDLEGAWQLFSYVIIDKNDKITHPYGQNALGYVTLSPYIIMSSNRSKIKSVSISRRY